MAKPGLKKGAEKEQTEIRKLKSFDLRLEGKSYRKIGELQDISEAQAHRDVTEVLRSTLDSHKEEIDEQRQIEIERLDNYIDSLDWKKNIGDFKTIEIMLKIQDRRAKLLVLDMPQKIAPTNPEGTEEYGGFTDDESRMERLIQICDSIRERRDSKDSK